MNWRGKMQGAAVALRCGRLLIGRGLSTTVFGWGSNDGAELGNGLALKDQTVPQVLKNVTEVEAVCCGYGRTHFYRNSHPELFSFGLNSVGQLGSNSNPNGHISKLNSNVTAVASGRAHLLVLTANKIFAAGSNIQGQCGLESGIRFSDGYEVVCLPFDATNVKQICCGLDSSLILTKDGKVLTTGLSADGQSGVGSYDCQYGFKQVIGDINSYNITQISATTDTCLALSDDGVVFGWGNNEQGQISSEISDKQIAIPVKIATKLTNVTHVLAGGSFSALIDDESVYIQGYGALGLGPDHFEVSDYTKVNVDESLGKVSILSGSTDYLAAITDAGHLVTWGRGNHGRLGHGNTKDCFYPKRVNLPGRVSAFSCGIDHMVTLLKIFVTYGIKTTNVITQLFLYKVIYIGERAGFLGMEQDNSSIGKLIYICGKSYSTTISECFSLKGKLIADLSLTCFVRTHTCPVGDMVDAYCAIAASHAFIFVLNEKTLYDPECLNQLGVAILYNIPVITVRIDGFELPKPLPLRFYETRFVDKRVAVPASKKDTVLNEIPLTLAGVILECFENSIVCKATSYVSFLREVARALSNATADAVGKSTVDTGPTDEESAGRIEPTTQVRHTRSGLGSSRTSRKALRNGTTSSSTYKQKGLQSIYGIEQKFVSRQPLVNRFTYKKTDINLSAMQNSFSRNGKRPPKIIGRQAFQREIAPGSAKGKENRTNGDEISLKCYSFSSAGQKESRLITTQSTTQRNIVEISKSTSSSALNLTIQSVKPENELLVPIIGPRGQKLRRYSSLPVVPTQYLVASEKKSGAFQVLSYPPANRTTSLSPRSDSPFLLNSDELDCDTIHISRTCTPVDIFESNSRSNSPETSSR